MKVKVELGRFAEEDSREELLNGARLNYNDFKGNFKMAVYFLIIEVLTIIILGITLTSEGVTLSKPFMFLFLSMFFLFFTVMFLLLGLKDFIQCKHNSTMAYLKKLHDDEKEQEEVK